LPYAADAMLISAVDAAAAMPLFFSFRCRHYAIFFARYAAIIRHVA